MTDEFYSCENCGAFNESTYIMYKIDGFERNVTKEEYEKICEICYVDAEEIHYCSICNEESEGVLVASSEYNEIF